MDSNLKDELRFINKSIEWSEKNTHLFYYSDSNIDIISELDKLFTSNFNKNNQVGINKVKTYDLDFFNPEKYFVNYGILLEDVKNNTDTFFIINCLSAKENPKSLGQLN